VRKGSEKNATCLGCGRGHTPSNNAIVFCDDCNGAWHQHCHDPPIDSEVVAIQEAKWFCKECKPAGDSATPAAVSTALADASTAGAEQVSATSAEATTTQTQTWLDKVHIEEATVPVASEVLVAGSQFSRAERRGYLAGLSHAVLLKLLVDITNAHPELPIFPDNLPELQSSAFAPVPYRKVSKSIAIFDISAPDEAAPPADEQPALGLSASVSTTEQVTTTTAAAPAMTRPANPAPESDDEDDVYVDHRLYPKAGNGFRFPPDSEALDVLLEDPNCPTFSHALHGAAKKKADKKAEATVRRLSTALRMSR
jgi:hypothetical protein